MRRTVVRVLDGDTIELNRKINNSRYVRLAGVEAPEKHQFGGSKATNILKGLVGGKQITLTPIAKDVYGRVIAEIRHDRRSINKRMRERGY